MTSNGSARANASASVVQAHWHSKLKNRIVAARFQRSREPLTQRPAVHPAPAVADPQPVTGEVAKIVFVAGISFSGSTLMGLLLGSRPNAIFGGELKDYKRRMLSEIRGSGTFCSCGGSRETCPFWSVVQERYGLETELSPSPGFSWQNFVIGLKLLAGIGLRRSRASPHGRLVKSIYEVARMQDPGVRYVVDTSKSISNLDAISRMPGVEVSVIHLVRNGTSVAGSYKKRGRRALYGMATWSIGNLFIRLYIRRRMLRSIVVDYRSLCVGDEATYRALNDFLGTDLNLARAAERISQTKFHIVSGNGKVRRSASNFQGVHYSESPFDASRLERFVADTVIEPLNRRFGATRQ